MDIETTTKQIITIDYGKSLQDMIAAGNYDWVNPDITPKSFSITDAGIVQFETKIFHFKRPILSEDAAAAIKADDSQDPWEPGKIEHLLAYGAQAPEEERQYPIVGLGSAAEVNGYRSVPCIDGDGAEHSLGLGLCGGGWHGASHFLAVRKLSSAT